MAQGIKPFDGSYREWPAKWVVMNSHVGQVYEAFKLYYQFKGKGLGDAVSRHNKALNNASMSQATVDYVIELEKLEEEFNK